MKNGGKSPGGNLVEYVIPLAVLALIVGVALFTLSASGYLQKFIASSSNANIENDEKLAINPGEGNDDPLVTSNNDSDPSDYSNLEPGLFGGTPEKPAKKCVDGKCIIDFGTFILADIPQNQDATTTSSRIVTDNIAAQFEFIAKQLKESGDLDGYNNYMELANLSHLLAGYEYHMEYISTAAAENKDHSTPEIKDEMAKRTYEIYQSNLDFNLNKDFSSSSDDYSQTMQKYQDLNNKLPGSLINSLKSDTFESLDLSNFSLGDARYMKNSDSATFDSKVEKNLSYALINAYDKVNDANYPPELKAATDVLMGQIDGMAYEMKAKSEILKKVFADQGINSTSHMNDIQNVIDYDMNIAFVKSDPLLKKRDMFTGNYDNNFDITKITSDAASVGDYLADNPAHSIIDPEASLITNMEAAIFCATGHGQDSGYTCK